MARSAYWTRVAQGKRFDRAQERRHKKIVAGMEKKKREARLIKKDQEDERKRASRRKCSDCHRVDKADGKSYCAGCLAKRKKAYRKTPSYKKWYAEYKASGRKAAAVARHKTGANLKAYGLTQEDYDEMVASQGNVCAICGASSDKPLSIDHCHKTQHVRGLLCTRCNTGLGSFGDEVRLLRAAAEYLAERL